MALRLHLDEKVSRLALLCWALASLYLVLPPPAPCQSQVDEGSLDKVWARFLNEAYGVDVPPCPEQEVWGPAPQSKPQDQYFFKRLVVRGPCRLVGRSRQDEVPIVLVVEHLVFEPAPRKMAVLVSQAPLLIMAKRVSGHVCLGCVRPSTGDGRRTSRHAMPRPRPGSPGAHGAGGHHGEDATRYFPAYPGYPGRPGHMGGRGADGASGTSARSGRPGSDDVLGTCDHPGHGGAVTLLAGKFEPGTTVRIIAPGLAGDGGVSGSAGGSGGRGGDGGDGGQPGRGVVADARRRPPWGAPGPGARGGIGGAGGAGEDGCEGEGGGVAFILGLVNLPIPYASNVGGGAGGEAGLGGEGGQGGAGGDGGIAASHRARSAKAGPRGPRGPHGEPGRAGFAGLTIVTLVEPEALEILARLVH